MTEDIHIRGLTALADLGEILGVKRAAGGGDESTVAYLEDLRMAARYLRFNLEVAWRETEQARGMLDFVNRMDDDDDDDDGYDPPFEGSPDDENFWIGPPGGRPS